MRSSRGLKPLRLSDPADASPASSLTASRRRSCASGCAHASYGTCCCGCTDGGAASLAASPYCPSASRRSAGMERRISGMPCGGAGAAIRLLLLLRRGRSRGCAIHWGATVSARPLDRRCGCCATSAWRHSGGSRPPAPPKRRDSSQGGSASCSLCSSDDVTCCSRLSAPAAATTSSPGRGVAETTSSMDSSYTDTHSSCAVSMRVSHCGGDIRHTHTRHESEHAPAPRAGRRRHTAAE